MAGPGLPVNIDSTYPNTGDASVVLHQQHHDAAHGIANLFDVANVATAGFVNVGNGTVFVSRALLSTDNPTIVTNTQSASYTLVLADAGKLVEMNVASANTLTVPPNSSVAFPVGTQIAVRQYGAGITTLTPGAAVTIRSRGSLTALAGTYGEAVLTKRATDEWVASGDLS
jgi:hypothetical protein